MGWMIEEIDVLVGFWEREGRGKGWQGRSAALKYPFCDAACVVVLMFI